MEKKIDKGSLRRIANDLNNCADSLIQIYPYTYISDDGLKWGNKNNIKDTIKQLKYDSYLITGELMEALDD